MISFNLSRAVVLTALVSVSSCDAITGRDGPSFHLALSADSLPVYQEGTVVALNAAGDTVQGLVDEWTVAHDQVAVVFATPDLVQTQSFEPAAIVEARRIGLTTISAEIDGERATVELVVVPPLVPQAPGVAATYFGRNHRVWVRWGPLDAGPLSRVYRKRVDESEWTVIAEGPIHEYHDFLSAGMDPTMLRYAAELCNETGCSGRGAGAAPFTGL
jgi:hypothetical protein